MTTTDFPDPAPNANAKKWPQHPEQANRFVLADGIYMGWKLITNHRKGGIKQIQEKIVLVWQSEEVDPDTGKRYELGDEYTYSAYESATLPGYLSAWLGSARAPVDTEENRLKLIKAIPKLVGRSGYGSVVWTKKGEKTYINVKTMSPLGKGMAPLAVEDYSRSDWYAKKAARYAAEVEAWKQEQLAAEVKAKAPKAVPSFDDVPAALDGAVGGSDDLPFAPDAGV